MSTNEQKTTSATGGVKAGNDQRVSLIPPNVLLEIGEHYGRGAKKYEDHNWAKGYEWSKSFDALMRHALQFWAGEDLDPETQSKHMIAVAWHAIALSHFMDAFPEYDDRHDWSQPESEPVIVDELGDEHKPYIWQADSFYGIRYWKWDHAEKMWCTRLSRGFANDDSKCLSDKFFQWGQHTNNLTGEGPFERVEML